MQLKFALLLALLCAMLPVPCFANPADSAEQTKQIEQASAQFYESLNTMFTGDAAPMSEVWSHSDDVTYMGPAGGIQVGWEQVRAMWEAHAEMKLGGKVVPQDVHVFVGQDLAIVQCREIGSNQNSSGEIEQVSIRATNVFRNENGAWKMIGHHTDLLPFLEKDSATSPISTSAE